MVRSLLKLSDLEVGEMEEIFKKIGKLKADIKKRKIINVLEGRVIGILFEKPSTRTRVSFDAAAQRLGGRSIYLSPNELQIKRGEPIKDTARILSGYLDALILRVNKHETLQEFVKNADIPVINALSDLTHPTQAICDLFTILEVKGVLNGLKLAYIGDGNNVCNSLLLASALTGMNMVAACPDGYHPDKDIFNDAVEIAKKTGGSLAVTKSPKEAAVVADILYTDTWVSMGEEAEKEKKIRAFHGYQINSEMLKLAKKDVCVMHCLPAYRGLEITDDVMEGEQSIIWQQGENKMYGAAGILDFMLTN